MSAIAWNRVAGVIGTTVAAGVLASGLSIGLAHYKGASEETVRGAALVGLVLGLVLGAITGGLAKMAKPFHDESAD